jgi:type II secretory pathway component PulF
VEFRCRVATASGQISETVYVAESEARLRLELEEKGLFLLDVQSKGGLNVGGDATTEWNLVMATAMLALLPPALVVILMQKWFVKGLVETEK